MERHVTNGFPVDVDVVGNLATASVKAVPFGSFAGGAFIPGTGITSIAFYGGMTEDGTYAEIKDSTNTAVTRTVTAGDGYALPDECFGWRFLKFVSNAAGEITLVLKS